MDNFKQRLNQIVSESINKVLNENIRPINEAFKSNYLRNWFKQHGGVRKDTMQDGLGDLNDDEISFTQEVDNERDAYNIAWKLRNEKDQYGRRTPAEIKNYYTIYKANDGACLIVGIDRTKVKTSSTWGGERTKKSAERFWRGDPTRFDNYHYSRKGQDFGLYTNKDFKNKMKDNEHLKSKMTDDQWNDYQDMRVKHMHDYLDRNYGHLDDYRRRFRKNV